MASTIQLRRGTAAQWTTANPVLANGEVGFESDTNKFKIGDGATTWNSNTLYFTTGGATSDYTYNVKSGGLAIPANGTTDARAALNTLVNTTMQTAGAGKEVFLPEGVYLINSAMTFPANVKLTFLKGARLKFAAGITVQIDSDIQAEPGQWIFESMGDAGSFTQTSLSALSYTEPSTKIRLFNSPVRAIYPEWFGAVRDGTTDDLKAFRLLMSAVTDYTGSISGVKGKTINLSRGIYHVSATIVLLSKIKMIGEGGGSQSAGSGSISQTIIDFPAGVKGIFVPSFNSFASNTAPYAAGSYFADFEIRGNAVPYTPINYAYGIEAQTQVIIERVTVEQFANHGIFINSNVNSVVADFCKIDSTTTAFNLGTGIRLEGSDSQAGTIINCNSQKNIGAGFYDGTLTGNLFISCHGATNHGGDYVTGGYPNTPTLVNCYSEGGTYPTDAGGAYLYNNIGDSTVVIGGSILENSYGGVQNAASRISGIKAKQGSLYLVIPKTQDADPQQFIQYRGNNTGSGYGIQVYAGGAGGLQFHNDLRMQEGYSFIVDGTGGVSAPTGTISGKKGVFTGALTGGVVQLTDAATVTTDASQGNLFSFVIGGNRTLAAPTNPTAGQVIRYRVRQDATGGRTLTLATGVSSGAFRFTSPAITTVTLNSAPSAITYITAIYNEEYPNWDVIDVK